MRIALGWLAAVAGVAFLAALAGCGGGGGGNNLPDPTLRFVNSSPDANPLDFFIDDVNKAPAITYLVDSGDITFEHGDHDAVVADSTDASVLDAVGNTFDKDKKYLGIALGLEFYGSEPEKRLRLIVFDYDKNPPNGSQARLLIMHGFMRSAGFQTPNIDFQNPGDNPQFKVADIPFGDTQAASIDVDAGVSLTFQARRAGTENVYASSTDTFDPGGIYLALVTGIENGVGSQVPQIKYIKLN